MGMLFTLLSSPLLTHMQVQNDNVIMSVSHSRDKDKLLVIYAAYHQ